MSTLNLFLFFMLLTMFSLFGQTNKTSFIEVNFGRGNHGSGDLPGYQYGFSYGKELKNKLYWQIGLEGSTNDDESLPLTIIDENGQEFNSTPHKVISGFQFVAGLKYNIVEVTHHQLGISVMPFGRYQASSISGSNVILFPDFTDLPYPVRLYLNDGLSRTFAFGGSVRLGYQYNLGDSLFCGILGGIQTDTNGDTIYNVSLSFGRRF